ERRHRHPHLPPLTGAADRPPPPQSIPPLPSSQSAGGRTSGPCASRLGLQSLPCPGAPALTRGVQPPAGVCSGPRWLGWLAGQELSVRLHAVPVYSSRERMGHRLRGVALPHWLLRPLL